MVRELFTYAVPRKLRPCKHDDEVDAPIDVATDACHAELGVAGAEDIVAVRRAVHPPVEGGLSCAGGVRSDHEILADPGITVALPGHPIPHGGAVRSGMAVEPVAGHIGGVDAGGGKQLALHRKCVQPARLALIVDELDDRVLMGGVCIGGAGGGDLRRCIAGHRGIRRWYHVRLRRRDEGIQRVGLGWCKCLCWRG